jgi:uncharacterized protein YydD (DUF2326 family)
MYLRKLYSQPEGLFQPIEFKDGINFIFGKKDKATDPKKSLNGIGKSLVLDLIDFCLLSGTQEKQNPRLFKAKKITSGFSIVLEFEVSGQFYLIRREVNNPNSNIEFQAMDKHSLYSWSELKPILCNLIFCNPKYTGVFSSDWLRKLIPFFVKIERPKKAKFLDPIHYIKECKLIELTQYHFLLMGISNSLVNENLKIVTALKERVPVLKGIEEFVKESYGVRDVSEATNEAAKMKDGIKKLEQVIAGFKLAEQYGDAEKEANSLTSRIKDLWYQNYSDRKRIESYKASFNLATDISPLRIRNIYKEFNELLSNAVKQTLENAINFRKQLAESRQNFLSQEIKQIETDIGDREKAISELEDQRAKMFTFLSTREAIRDLSEAYLSLSQKREKASQLEGKIGMYNDLLNEKADIEIEQKKLAKEMLKFVSESETQLYEFRRVFSSTYNSIYSENQDKSVFALKFNEKSDVKIEINVVVPAMDSKGKNQGRTLIYDLSMLFNAMQNNIPCPRFLIHDGIFDGMDKAHFVHLYELLEKLKTKYRFQYIVTLNEEGILNENFGHAEKVTTEKIEKEAIIVLTPTNKLLGKEF